MSGAAGAGASKQVDLAQVSIPRLLFALLHQRFTGSLVLDQPPPHAGRRTVWFRGGMPAFTDWVAPSEVLGQVLVTQRMISEDQLLRALEAMAVQGGLLGQHLLYLNVLDRPRLYEGLRVQCTRKLVQLFGLRAGTAWVTVSDGRELEAELLPVNVLGLILAGVSQAYDENRVAAEMGTALHSVLQATASLGRYRSHFRFRPHDEPMLQALAVGTGFAQLAAMPGSSPRRAAQLAFTLWACQMLRIGAPVQAGMPGVAAPAAPAAPVRPAAAMPGVAAARPAAGMPGVAAPARPAAAMPGVSAPAASVAAPAAPARPAVPTQPVAAKPAAPKPAVAATPAAAPEPATPKPELDTSDPFLAELVALEAKIEAGGHAFELFGIPLTAKKKDVRRAWGELSKKFHPDALKGDHRDHRERVNDVFAALSEAQQVLNDADQREKLKEAIESGEHEANKGGRDATATARAVFQSELVAKEADKLLRANRFDRALEGYREAANYNPDEPDIKAAIVWCEYQVSDKSTSDSAKARTLLNEIIAEAPNIARAHYFLGFVLLDQGSPMVAVEVFRKAAKLDPRLIDAERQARALEVRFGRTPASSTKSKRGGLKGLFGKK